MTSGTASKTTNDELWVWGSAAEKPRVLHTMIRVRDLDASLRFYTEGFGMKPMGERFEFKEHRATAIFIGYDSYEAGNCLELIKEWDREEPYSHGSGYGHIAIGCPDVRKMVARLREFGATVTVEPVVVLEGGPHVAFVTDPDGYAIELIETRRY